MKNKNLIIIIAVGMLVLVVGGFVILSSMKKTAPVPVEQAPAEETISIMKPEEIGLSLIQSSDTERVIFEITNVRDISGIEYELTYSAIVNKEDVDRGVNGSIDVGQLGKPVKREIILGTCSDVCHYDQDVANIKLILKVTKTDGTTSQVEQSLEL